MTDKDVFQTLASVSFVQDIEPEQLRELAAISQVVHFPRGRVIFHESDLLKDVYLIAQGRVSVSVCTPKLGCRFVTEVGDGELLGWSPLLRRKHVSATAHAKEPTTAVVIDGSAVLKLCSDKPELGFELMRRTAEVLAQRLGDTRLKLLDSVGMNLPEVVLESD